MSDAQITRWHVPPQLPPTRTLVNKSSFSASDSSFSPFPSQSSVQRQHNMANMAIVNNRHPTLETSSTSTSSFIPTLTHVSSTRINTISSTPSSDQKNIFSSSVNSESTFFSLGEKWKTCKTFPIELSISSDTSIEVVAHCYLDASTFQELLHRTVPHSIESVKFKKFVVQAMEYVHDHSWTKSFDFKLVEPEPNIVSGQHSSKLFLFRCVMRQFVDPGIIWDSHFPWFFIEYYELGKCRRNESSQRDTNF